MNPLLEKKITKEKLVNCNFVTFFAKLIRKPSLADQMLLVLLKWQSFVRRTPSQEYIFQLSAGMEGSNNIFVNVI